MCMLVQAKAYLSVGFKDWLIWKVDWEVSSSSGICSENPQLEDWVNCKIKELRGHVPSLHSSWNTSVSSWHCSKALFTFMKWKPLIRSIWIPLISILCEFLLILQTVPVVTRNLKIFSIFPFFVHKATERPEDYHGLSKIQVAQMISAIKSLLWKSGRVQLALSSLEIIRMNCFVDREVGRTSEIKLSQVC